MCVGSEGAGFWCTPSWGWGVGREYLRARLFPRPQPPAGKISSNPVLLQFEIQRLGEDASGRRSHTLRIDSYVQFMPGTQGTNYLGIFDTEFSILLMMPVKMIMTKKKRRKGL